MTKGIIIIGGQVSAQEIAKNQDEKTTVLIDSKNLKRNYYQFFFNECDKETKTVIIDMKTKEMPIELYYNLIDGIISINKRHQEPFEIELDKLILVYNSKIKKEDMDLSASTSRRFTILESKDFFKNKTLDLEVLKQI